MTTRLADDSAPVTCAKIAAILLRFLLAHLPPHFRWGSKPPPPPPRAHGRACVDGEGCVVMFVWGIV